VSVFTHIYIENQSEKGGFGEIKRVFRGEKKEIVEGERYGPKYVTFFYLY